MRISLVMALALVSITAAAGTASAASRPIVFNLGLGNGYMHGSATDGATVHLRWKSATGQLKAEADVTAQEWGSWWFDAPPGVVLERGDRLFASDGYSSRKFVVPQLTAVANRIKNVFKGSAPAGTNVFIECTYPGQPVPDIACDRERVRANDAGSWFYRPGYDLRGGDGAYLAWRSAEGDWVDFSVKAPFVAVTIGRAQVTGIGRPDSSLFVKVRDSSHGDVIGSWTGPVGARQEFVATLRDAPGQRVFVSPGMHVVSDIASDASFTVPHVHAAADVETDTVTGYCEDTGRSAHEVYVRIYRAGKNRGFAITDTALDGSFVQDMTEVDFPKASVIKHGDELLITCVLKNRDQVHSWFSVP